MLLMQALARNIGPVIHGTRRAEVNLHREVAVVLDSRQPKQILQLNEGRLIPGGNGVVNVSNDAFKVETTTLRQTLLDRSPVLPEVGEDLHWSADGMECPEDARVEFARPGREHP